MASLHDLIYRLEEKGGKSLFQVTASTLGLLLVILAYNWFCFRNMATAEAMDCAQIARNIARGNGFTTLFVRPFSLRLLRNHASAQPELKAPGEIYPSQLKGMQQDITNPPLYPVILAGLMKVIPFSYPVDLTHRFWSTPGRSIGIDPEETAPARTFRRYQPDFLISAFNQGLFLIVAVLSFVLAQRLFDSRTAMLSTALLLGTDLLWRFAVSGLPTILLLLIFICLVWCLVSLEKEANSPQAEPQSLSASEGVRVIRSKKTELKLSSTDVRVFIWSALAGLLVGFGALTRYPFAWLILPVLFFVFQFTGPNRVMHGLIAFLAFAMVLTPWVLRNVFIIGAPFGTATYAILEDTALFPGDSLGRSLDPNLSLPGLVFAKVAWSKLLSNGLQIVQNDIPRLGGTWVGSFFVMGLLVPLAERRTRRLGWFLAISLAVLVPVQALSQTHLSKQSPSVNSENLLVLLVPAVWIYGANFFLRLLAQIDWPLRQLRAAAIGVFLALTCLPMIISLLTASRSPVVFPPYLPPSLQEAAGFVKTDEWMMSDIPWAAAWYGRAQCIWLTRTKQDFFVLNDRLKTIQALYLTHASYSGPFESFDQWLLAGDEGWGDLILRCVSNKNQGEAGPPSDFPLEYWQKGWPLYFLLTARQSPLNSAGLP
jgi:4-amino-4-deoxy-L-arabinose transferase-like glycosyltransferase